jgi:lipooligosaccharide transport system ATP-binding protein
MPIIEVRNAVKKYGEITAVAGLDLTVDEGECFGLLGPNGAGKTSLIRMITCLSPPSSGNIRVGGKDIRRESRQIKASLGVVPQEENLDPDLSVLQNLVVFARYFDIPKREALQRAAANLGLFELQDRQKAQVEQLSGGMKRRLLIARALINNPKLLILDEPTVGLDPQTRHLVWQKLVSLRAQGMTLFLCTQNMEEAWRLCGRLAIMNEGRVIAQGTPRELLAKHGGSQVLEIRPAPEAKSNLTKKLKECGFQWQEVEDMLYIFQGDGQVVGEDLRREMVILNQHVPTLEDVFLKLTGRAIRE